MKFSLALALVLSLTLFGCGARSTDEEQVRALIDGAEAAAEARDASDVMAFVADDYSDAQGLDRAAVQNFLRGYFLANPRVELLVNVRELEFPVEGLAHATLGVASLPAGDRATLRVEFRKQGGTWRVARADRVRD